MNDAIERKLRLAPKRWYLKLTVALVFAAIIAWSSTAVDASGTDSRGLLIARGILLGLVRPNKELLLNMTKQGVAYLLLETVCIAYLGTLVGAIIAIPLAFLSSAKIVPKPVVVLGRAVTMAVRTIPAFVYGLMFIRVTGPGAFAGLLTMSMCSVGMVSKMYIEFIDDLDKKIFESLDACGCTAFQKIRYGIIPQLIPDFISTIIYRFDMNLRDATVLGLVGAGGIGAPLIFAMGAYRWSEVGAILIGLIVLILIIEFFSSRIRRKLARGL
ncbi:MAG: phosphonate ABC transporter, permease protein PhnE [Oscillospiraceae bacterium]|jgi:phosphonate transport system permease protein|nr:phosphonate ABC transporter, permease protein PhnE [Oscillospiraceae bacterium]